MSDIVRQVRFGRGKWIKPALRMFKQRGLKTVVEIGSIRPHTKPEDGYSTVAWGIHVPEVFSVDIDPICKEHWDTSLYPHVNMITKDGIEFLKDFNRPIDLLYLDFNHERELVSAKQHLACFEQAQFHDQSMILIADQYPKGRLLMHSATKLGWKIVSDDRMLLLIK